MAAFIDAVFARAAALDGDVTGAIDDCVDMPEYAAFVAQYDGLDWLDVVDAISNEAARRGL